MPPSTDQKLNLTDIGDLLKDTLPDVATRFKGDMAVPDANANLRTLDTAVYEFSRLSRPEREEMGVKDADLSALKGAAEALRIKIAEKTRASAAIQPRRSAATTARSEGRGEIGKRAADHVAAKMPNFFTGRKH
jgi:hypothetical protein